MGRGWISVAPRLGVAALLVALMLARATTVYAQPAAGAVMEGARVLFEQGVAAAQAGEWEQAADRFRQAFSLWQSPVIEYNLAKALAELGRLCEAADIFERTQNAADAPENIRVQSRDALREIESQLAVAVVRVEGPMTEGTRVQVDDTERAVGVPVRLDPGAHHVVLMRGSEVLDERNMELAAGRIEVTLRVPVPVVAPVVTLAPDSSRSGDSGAAPVLATPPATGSRHEAATRSLWPVVLAGAGLALGVTGYFVHGHAEDELSDFEDAKKLNCSDERSPGCGEFLRDGDRDRGEVATFRDLGTIGLVVGGALVATGAVWWVWGSNEERAPASIACGPALLGAQCAGQF